MSAWNRVSGYVVGEDGNSLFHTFGRVTGAQALPRWDAQTNLIRLSNENGTLLTSVLLFLTPKEHDETTTATKVSSLFFCFFLFRRNISSPFFEGLPWGVGKIQ